MPNMIIFLSDFFQSFRILCLEHIYPLKTLSNHPSYVFQVNDNLSLLNNGSTKKKYVNMIMLFQLPKG